MWQPISHGIWSAMLPVFLTGNIGEAPLNMTRCLFGHYPNGGGVRSKRLPECHIFGLKCGKKCLKVVVWVRVGVQSLFGQCPIRNCVKSNGASLNRGGDPFWNLLFQFWQAKVLVLGPFSPKVIWLDEGLNFEINQKLNLSKKMA